MGPRGGIHPARKGGGKTSWRGDICIETRTEANQEGRRGGGQSVSGRASSQRDQHGQMPGSESELQRNRVSLGLPEGRGDSEQAGQAGSAGVEGCTQVFP